MTAEVYFDPASRDEVAVAWSAVGPFHTLRRDGSVEHGFAPRRFLTLLHGDAVDELQEKLDDAHDEAQARHEDHLQELDDAHDEAQARHEDHLQELSVERASADEDARQKVLEAIEKTLDLGEVRALLHPGLEHARDALRDELVFQFTEVGDPVLVTTEPATMARTYAMRVTQPPMLSDGAYGEPGSLRVTVSLGPGRWSTEVSADSMVDSGYKGRIPRRFRLELDVWRVLLDQLTAAATVGEVDAILGRAQGHPAWSEEHTALAELRLEQLCAPRTVVRYGSFNAQPLAVAGGVL